LLKKFNQYSEETVKEWFEDRTVKDKFFKDNLVKDKISKIDEGTLRDFVRILQSFNSFTNKDYLLKEMLKTGLPEIKKALKYLLYGEDSIDKRFDYVLENVKMLG